jgi:hypothetical protein
MVVLFVVVGVVGWFWKMDELLQEYFSEVLISGAGR